MRRLLSVHLWLEKNSLDKNSLNKNSYQGQRYEFYSSLNFFYRQKLMHRSPPCKLHRWAQNLHDGLKNWCICMVQWAGGPTKVVGAFRYPFRYHIDMGELLTCLDFAFSCHQINMVYGALYTSSLAYECSIKVKPWGGKNQHTNFMVFI